jgi:acyl carrier protein
MNNLEKLVNVFAESLGIDRALVKDELEYNTIPQWDSLAHMKMIAALENTFDILLDTDDIIDMNSVARAKEILAKYEVAI